MDPPPRRAVPQVALRSAGELLAWLGGIVFTLSAFMGWYSLSDDVRGTLSVLGWHTGTVGKLAFVVGLAMLALLALRAVGIDLPPAVPSGMAIALLGLVGTILVLIRVIDVPERFEPSVGRSIGIWISLLAALLVIAAGLLKSADEL